MKLPTDMLTDTGFISEHFEKEEGQTLEEFKPCGKKYYVGISGGGWRAQAAHMGAFRVLGEKDSLSMVNMLSSVSGGTWFLTKLGFDDEFAGKVLGNEAPIGAVVSEWFEDSYFAILRNLSVLCRNRLFSSCF